MEALVMGTATAFNILVIFRKAELHRYQDAFLDASLLIVLSLVFGGSLGGMMVATVASAIISIYFLFNEPNFTFNIDLDDEEENEEEKRKEDIRNLYKKYNIKA